MALQGFGAISNDILAPAKQKHEHTQYRTALKTSLTADFVIASIRVETIKQNFETRPIPPTPPPPLPLKRKPFTKAEMQLVRSPLGDQSRTRQPAISNTRQPTFHQPFFSPVQFRSRQLNKTFSCLQCRDGQQIEKKKNPFRISIDNKMTSRDLKMSTFSDDSRKLCPFFSFLSFIPVDIIFSFLSVKGRQNSMINSLTDGRQPSSDCVQCRRRRRKKGAADCVIDSGLHPVRFSTVQPAW
jgi:hypothetical protein